MPIKNQSDFVNRKSLIIEEEFQLLPLFKVYKIRNTEGEEIGMVKQIFSPTSKALELYTNKVKPILEFEIFDFKGKLLASFKRNWNFVLTDAEILNDKKKIIAVVQQKFNLLNLKLNINNAKGDLQAELKGSKLSKKITITNSKGVIIGKISPKWSGMVKEFVTKNNSYNLEFNSAIKSKNTLVTYITAVVLIDLMVKKK